MKNTRVKKPIYLLLSIILLTMSAVMATCTLLWITGADPLVVLVVGISTGSTGIYAYHGVALLMLHIKCAGIEYDE